MSNQDHFNILRSGVKEWNEWRKSVPGIRPNLEGFDLSDLNLSGVNFFDTNLYDVRFEKVNLTSACLDEAGIYGTFFRDCILRATSFNRCTLGFCTFINMDLRGARGLDNVTYVGPSSIDINTIYKSQGKFPPDFLRESGVPEELINYIPSLLGAREPFQFYSCFISYSSKDENFAKRLHSRMRDEKLQVWFAPEDIKGGKKIYDQIESAIHIHDRLLLVISEESMQSEWVFTEIKNAFREEKQHGRRKLFPIRLVDFDKIKEWKLIDSDWGKDLAAEIRSYHIPDFSNWKDHDAFELAFSRLLRDLKAEEKNG
ncbi:MAG TPA: toll/interleukin-1 receptor domain-containing protein [Puia sp.]|nr:toll/interleukin-1 receptor domain-containing protein [Puia sp.]